MRRNVFLFFVIFSVSSAIAYDACTNIRHYLTQINDQVDQLCTTGTTLPTTPTTPPPTTCTPPPTPAPVQECMCPVEWESISLTRLGTINMGSTSTQSYTIPSTVPTAKEVLVYIYVYMGTSSSLFSTMEVHTEVNTTRKFVKYLPLRTWSQNAISSVSENMWFPLTSNRRLYVKLSVALTGSLYGFVNIIGYR